MPKSGNLERTCVNYVAMKLLVSYVLLFGWMVVIFLLSSEGHDVSTERSDAVVRVLQTFGISGPVDVLTFIARKSAHTVAYLILGLLAYNVLRQYKLSGYTQIAVSIGVVMLYAMSDELHQLYVPGRSGELRDVAIDSVAGVIGVLMAYFISHKYVLHKSQK